MFPNWLASVPAYPVAASPLSREPSRAQQWARASIQNTDSACRAYWVAKPGESLHVDSTDAEWLWQPGIDRHAFFGWAASRGMDTNPAQPAQGVGRRKLHGGNRGVRKPGSTRQPIGLTAGETAPIPSATRRFPVAPAIGLRLECVAATSTRMLVTAGKDLPNQWTRSTEGSAAGNSAWDSECHGSHRGRVGLRWCIAGPTASSSPSARDANHERRGAIGVAGIKPGRVHHQRAGTWQELRGSSARHLPMTHVRDRGAVESANSARHGGECNLPAHHHSSGAG